jgi:nicotinate-nucleotide pyrophosphorylase (carboxylating)
LNQNNPAFLKNISLMTIDDLIIEALREDLGDGDHTSLATIPGTARGKARLLVKEDGVIAGLDIARKVFSAIDKELILTIFVSDGADVKNGDVVFEIAGSSISILSAERLVLNFMQRMSGIATSTKIMCDRLKGLNTKILDTRKTTPLLREIEKLAVRIGGGFNHRFGLYDMILIKDNHVDFAGGIANAIHSTTDYLHRTGRKLKIEIETRSLEEVQQVLAIGGVDRIMLDNFDFPELQEAVNLINHRFETEASGGITLDTIRKYAECGVDFISVGALTHHISSLDLSLKAVR